jgi:uncharacterized protein YukJ
MLSGAVVDTRREDDSDSPHYQIHLVDDSDTHFRVAVNVQSAETPSELLYLVDEDFRHPVTAALQDSTSGWTPLPAAPGGANLDYVRANLFDPAAMRLLPPDAAGPDNDLADLLDHYVLRGQRDDTIIVHAYGARWGPEPGIADKVFGFLPGNGVHDIHLNQGNSPRFAGDDGVWQDGGLLLHLAAEQRWIAIFLAFQSQHWHTDDLTGHALPDTPVRPQTTGSEPVRVLAALVNPTGGAPEAETILLINASSVPQDLSGWRIADRAKHTCPIPHQTLAPGATATIQLIAPVALGNNGGAITLLDPTGLKVHGVSYTAEQAHNEGWTITF